MLDLALKSDVDLQLIKLLEVMHPRIIKVSSFTRNEQVNKKIRQITDILQSNATEKAR